VSVRIELELGQLPRILRKHGEEGGKAVARGAMRAAIHAQADLKAAKEPRDRGLFAAAWKIRSDAGTIVLYNDAPYAGILEAGARPHGVSKEGQALIRAWVIRKGVLMVAGRGGREVRVTGRNANRYEKAIDDAVWAICAKIKAEGQKPLWVVKKRLPAFSKYLQDEIKEQIEKLLSDPRP
jgi:hypothetical protein